MLILLFEEPLGEEEGDQEDRTDDEKRNNSTVRPGVRAPTPDEGENDADASSEEEDEAEVVDLLEFKSECLMFFGGIVSRGADSFAKEEEEYDVSGHTNRKIDCKTPSPRNRSQDAAEDLCLEDVPIWGIYTGPILYATANMRER
jgi:hypothetical protein